MNKKYAKQVYNYLQVIIPNPQTELNYSSNFELLIAVILSAQCTDKRVNIVTEKLFQTHNKPHHFANMNPQVLEKFIYSTGFYKNKSKNIIALSHKLLEKYDGEVPSTFNQLIDLPGVGRKTANVVLSVAFNVPSIAVDTHVFRVSNRLNLVKAKTPLECENQLKALYEPKYYAKLHHLLVLFGRHYCTARNKSCDFNYLKQLYLSKINSEEHNVFR